MEFELTIESGVFTELREDFNEVLAKTLVDMEDTRSEEAEVTVKLKIELKKDTAPDFSEVRYKADRDIVRTEFSHKISSVMQIKRQKSGTMDGEYELIWDKDKGIYIIRPIDYGQTRLLDNEESSDNRQRYLLSDNYEYEETRPEEESNAGKQE